MRKHLFTFLFLLISTTLFGQENDVFTNHQLSIDFGSIRNTYFYPITNIKYSSPILKKANFTFSARLRSYGSLLFYSKSAYDITPYTEYFFNATKRPFYFSVGIGFDTRIRLVNDSRSEAKSSIEPMISLTAYGKFKRFSFNVPLWTRFYSNGFSLTILPEGSYQLNKRFSLFLRNEISYLTLFKISDNEWRQDFFIGTHFSF
jgi:hypothetical protein